MFNAFNIVHISDLRMGYFKLDYQNWKQAKAVCLRTNLNDVLSYDIATFAIRYMIQPLDRKSAIAGKEIMPISVVEILLPLVHL